MLMMLKIVRRTSEQNLESSTKFALGTVLQKIYYDRLCSSGRFAAHLSQLDAFDAPDY